MQHQSYRCIVDVLPTYLLAQLLACSSKSITYIGTYLLIMTYIGTEQANFFRDVSYIQRYLLEIRGH